MSDPEFTREHVLKALTDQWLSVRAVHRIIDIGSETTVGHRLRELAEDGLIEREVRTIAQSKGGQIAMYRRAQRANPA